MILTALKKHVSPGIREPCSCLADLVKECGVWCVKVFERGGFEGMHDDKVSKKGQLACGLICFR